jgi:exodeoxyribonuclease V beta subunit
MIIDTKEPVQELIQTGREFDLFSAPLDRHVLIEANAGTGKTFTISRLFVRFLLEKRFAVSSILVVTFTEAATVELKERIHSLLGECRAVFEKGCSDDPFFSMLLNRIDHRLALGLLTEALHSFDSASIYTIHGFCRTILTRHPFECRMPFKAEIITNQSDLIDEIIADFWRKTIDAQSAGFAGYCAFNDYNPLKLKPLWNSISSTVSEVSIVPAVTFIPCDQVEQRWAQQFEVLKQQWAESRGEIYKQLSSGALNANSYKPSIINSLIDEVDLFLKGAAQFAQLPEKFDRLTPLLLQKYTKAKCATPDHPFFSTCASAIEAFDARETVYKNNLLHIQRSFILFVRKELAIRKDKKSQLYFDDLLLKVESALKDSRNSSLIKTLQGNYQAALIDEFQDTDQIQYFIFATIFARSPLFLIGDPKQSIYRFRGADIFTYLTASQKVELSFTLSKNYRSHPNLVRAVNSLFCRSPHLFLSELIVAKPSESALSAEDLQLSIDGVAERPMNWICFNALKSDEIYSRIIETVSDRIAFLVAKGSQGKAHLGKDKAVSALDIAVLVRRNREAQLIHNALIQKGIPAVIESGSSVFSTEEANELFTILTAIASPQRPDYIRAALITTLMGFNVNDLDRLSSEYQDSTIVTTEQEWETITANFFTWREIWESHGISYLMRRFLLSEKVRTRVLSAPAGERKLTNIMHIVELMFREEQNERKGIPPLLEWFGKKLRNSSDHVPDDEMLRLESDADSVSIITVHRSKGLQFPIVFCPFVWNGFDLTRNSNDPYIVHQENCAHPLVVLADPDRTQYFNRYETETLAEEMRLLYVALTRAESCCYAVMYHKSNSDAINAAAYLLFSDGAEEPPAAGFRAVMGSRGDFDINQALTDLFSNEKCISFQNADLCDYSKIEQSPVPVPALSVRMAEHPIPDPWRITSFSSLSKTHHENDRVNDDTGNALKTMPSDTPDDQLFETIGMFPRGEKAGLFLHELLEKTDLSSLGSVDPGAVIRESLSLYNFDPQWEGTVTELLSRIAELQLPPSGIQLKNVSKTDCIKELQFHFPVNDLTPQKLQRALIPEQPDLFSPTPYTAENVDFKRVSGFMKGFIDLLISIEGKFYIIDWKSNYLGSTPDEYTVETMEREMNAKHYKLQYYIYTIAVYRYLSMRVKGFDYSTHFGGVYYLFFRGLQAGKNTGVYYDCPKYDLISSLDGLF